MAVARATTFTGTTAWARNLAAPVRDFLSTETGSAALLLGAAVAALVWANISQHSYESFWTTKLSIQLGSTGISADLRHWVNEGLMTFFFLVVGLEAKRELDVGELRERRGSRCRCSRRSAEWPCRSPSTWRSTPVARAPTDGGRRCPPTRRSRSARSRWSRRARRHTPARLPAHARRWSTTWSRCS